MKKFATVEVAGQKLELDAPGLKIHRREGREPYVIWSAPPHLTAMGFRPKSVRLDPDWSAPADFERIAGQCREFQRQALAWGSRPEPPSAPAAEGTIGALIERYLSADHSPLRSIKASTKATYLRWLQLLAPYHETLLAEIDDVTMRQCCEALGMPAKGETTSRPRRATAGMQMLRLLLRFGAGEGLPNCAQLLEMAMDSEFDSRPVPRAAMSRELATQFVDYALSVGDARMALAQACQTEMGLRQSEVIGEWNGLEPGVRSEPAEIVFQRQRWSGGLTFEMIDGVSFRRPGADASIDLSKCPMVLKCLEAICLDRGPLIVNEDGRPYDRFTFSRRWRKIASAAGIPVQFRNMDSHKAK
jgi:hypothetical protein